MNFVSKINVFNESPDAKLQPELSPLACPRYLVHMKAYDKAAKTLSELESRAKMYMHKPSVASSKEVTPYDLF